MREIGTDKTLYAFRRNLVVAASAGTGKTHSLVGVIVHLLLGASEIGGEGLHEAVDPGRVVATTFSRKAAAEIRARIVEELARLVNRDPASKYRLALDAACARVGTKSWGDRQVAERARRALDGLGRAQIGTLHSFAGTIARAHALELGLSPGFEMVDEEQNRRRVEEAIQRVLERAFVAAPEASAENPVRELVDVAGGVDRLVSQIARLLARIEEDGRGAADLALAADDASRAEEALVEVVLHARSLAADPRFEGPALGVMRAWEARDEGALARAIPALLSVKMSRAPSPAAEAFFVWRDDLPRATNAERGRRLLAVWQNRDRFLPSAARARDLLAECQGEIARATWQSSALGFGDVLRAARDVLRDHPRTAAELGASLDVLLVDEFQDTSRLQRELVQLVWARRERRTAGIVPSLSDLRPAGLFVVGDRKQSIYGFRGADVGVFAELCVGLAGAPAREALGIPPHAAWEPEEPAADFISLRHNRRGEARLLTFANAFSPRRFAVAEQPSALYEIEYVPETEDLLPPLLSPPGVASASRSPGTTWLRTVGQRDSQRLDEALVMAQRIRRIVRDATPTVKGAPPRWRDIAILAQTNDMLDAAAFALAQGGIPHVVAGRGFFSAPEVRDLVAFLTLVCEPSDELAMLEVLRGPWAGVHDATLIGLTDPHRGLAEVGPAWDEGERRPQIHAVDRPALAEVRRTVRELRRNLDRLGPGGVLREAVRELELEETLILLPRGTQRIANVRKLLDLADRQGSARELLQRLEEAAERDTAESEAATFSDEDDAVRLLTVHASKGLDFPIVFVPQVGLLPRGRERAAMALDVHGRGGPSILTVRVTNQDGSLCDPPSYARAHATAERRERAERQRLTYVAVTRASEAMYFVGSRSVPKSGETAPYRATTAAILNDLAGTEDLLRAAELTVEDVVAPSPVADAPTPARPTALPVDPDPRLGPPAWRSLAIAPTSLQDFHSCRRRFQLVHLLDLPERASFPAAEGRPREEASAGAAKALDARAEGTLAHRILERIPGPFFGDPEAAREVSVLLAREGIAAEHPQHGAVVGHVVRFLTGAYAGRVAALGAEVLREQSFVLSLPDAEGRVLVLRGSIDLLVRWPDGHVDIVDYKRARGPVVAPYAFQLDVYLLAAREIFPDAGAMRAGIVFLGGDASEPAWCTSSPADAVRARLVALGRELVLARWSETYPRVEPPVCRALHCGYVGLCHPGPRG